ncbi:hypothetical protein [Thermanaeromonas toyohensis]|uniref:hypothetical protein n=1 Tax=Thermanaeromonas toyohensis TaxID=161154 RepID=UPI0015604E0D|nr:hypothetical protein [Thermanaeromonas toyohensis]
MRASYIIEAPDPGVAESALERWLEGKTWKLSFLKRVGGAGFCPDLIVEEVTRVCPMCSSSFVIRIPLHIGDGPRTICLGCGRNFGAVFTGPGQSHCALGRGS